MGDETVMAEPISITLSAEPAAAATLAPAYSGHPWIHHSPPAMIVQLFIPDMRRGIVNIDFSADATFSWYVVLLMVSGVAMLIMAAIGGGQGIGARLLNAAFGVGFLGYAVYLNFIFDGGEYAMFFYAFILPVLMLFRFVGALLRGFSPYPRPELAARHADIVGDPGGNS
ncbi:hypothetical protein E1287_11255 [Actinomadura sp. KC06]|uniref:hypothetical protein n=1 Tax=Actinomadura sp. KC06 TaxID=2530369 RepID=UPI00104FEF08|nr:hypothetical protein [Actinomadura sp. KC06]TDD36419.1 hypothetical protein E1287_11255 [Actinomadura sp. KC06]